MAYDAEVLADGPNGYWRFGEPSGTTAADASGNGNDGTYTGGFTLGQAGALAAGDTAVRLNGTTGYITVPDNALLDPGDTFTLELWFKRTAISDGKLLSKGANGYFFGFVGDVLHVAHEGNVIIASATTTITDTTTWHHAAWTKSGATNKIYLDRVDVTGAVTNGTIVATANALIIGAKSDLTEFVSAILDEVAIYPTALSSARVFAHYDAADDPAGGPVALDGTSAATSTTTGAAVLAHDIGGSAAAASTTSASAVLALVVDGSAEAESTTTATLTVPAGAVNLAGSAAAASVAQATLEISGFINTHLAGSSAASSSASADLDRGMGLMATTTAASGSIASLTLAMALPADAARGQSTAELGFRLKIKVFRRAFLGDYEDVWGDNPRREYRRA